MCSVYSAVTVCALQSRIIMEEHCTLCNTMHQIVKITKTLHYKDYASMTWSVHTLTMVSDTYFHSALLSRNELVASSVESSRENLHTRVKQDINISIHPTTDHPLASAPAWTRSGEKTAFHRGHPSNTDSSRRRRMRDKCWEWSDVPPSQQWATPLGNPRCHGREPRGSGAPTARLHRTTHRMSQTLEDFGWPIRGRRW